MSVGSSTEHEWRVTGMDCGSCAAKVRGAVERLPGVGDVDVALMTELMSMGFGEEAVRAALVMGGNDKQRAIEFLLG